LLVSDRPQVEQGARPRHETDASPHPGWERTAAAALLVLVPAGLAGVLLAALGLPHWLAGALAATFAIAGALSLRRRLPPALDKIARTHRALSVLWAAVAIFAAVQTGRLGIFMLDPSRTECSAAPWTAFMTNHSCLTAYTEAARLVRSAPNVYDPALYRSTPAGRYLGRFRVDTYEYPPPFLTLPRLAEASGADFFAVRPVWFALEGLTLLGALAGLALLIGDREGLRFGLLIPAIWVSLPTQLTLQMGNVQFLVQSLALLALVALARRRDALGGGLLAFAVVTKIFPAVLLLLLAFQRRWRAVAWTIAACAGLCAVGVLALGSASFVAFVRYQIPRLASGEAFPMLKALPWAVAINESVYGIPLKLGRLGVPGMGFGAASFVGWLYTVLLVAAAWAVRRAQTRTSATKAWLALLGFAALRSPFLPQEYSRLVPLCLLALHAAEHGWSGPRWVILAAGYLVLSNNVPFEAHASLPVVMLLAGLAQAAAAAVMGVALADVLRMPERSEGSGRNEIDPRKARATARTPGPQ
jgi:hypothetical protein